MAAADLFDDRVCTLGEGPYYDDETGRVGWVDILRRRVLWREAAGAEAGEFPVAADIGAAVPRRSGGLVLCLPAGPALLAADGSVRPLAGYAAADTAAGLPPAAGAPRLRSNDAKADPAGRLWLGTMAYDETPGAGALYRLDPGATGPKWVLGGVTISNGLGWSPDGSTMYYVDTPTRRVDAFDYHVGTGDISARREFVRIDSSGSPDGLCVDAAGGVWVALWQGAAVHRYTPDGKLDRVVAVPADRVTSCTFAGADLRLLVITTAALDRPGDTAAGRTYVHQPTDITGLPTNRYAG